MSILDAFGLNALATVGFQAPLLVSKQNWSLSTDRRFIPNTVSLALQLRIAMHPESVPDDTLNFCFLLSTMD
eukprot:CAMPEP_0184678644 /NCGR_PEP_ID=MMETSP0312-20130426/1409_1 /TAXON_ID=31354 /ORGANISM="Compsopogon coeruleus, Strain SAG 36.94" /LENGTH=71 /DNA_ID=CAMNT_0027127531 /DNA_START=696 /DNA_END=911 /DNA_ORIENTATION=+